MAEKKQIQVLVVRVGEAASVEQHMNSLEAQQALVGGYIQAIGFGGGLVLICDEDGNPKDLPPNFALPGNVIVGNAFFCRQEDSEFASLTDHDIKRLKAVVRTGRLVLGVRVW